MTGAHSSAAPAKMTCKDCLKLYPDESHRAPARVAQLDRASVYGTDDKKSQGACGETTCGNHTNGACHSLCQTLAETGPELAVIVTAWPSLPEAVKAGISAMVRASVPAVGE